jgi:hypothetical protein
MTQAQLIEQDGVLTPRPASSIEIPEIQVSTNYAMFKLMTGNRPVDYTHVKRLKRSMEADPHLFPSNPIQVNEHMFIIDGQHRRLAAQELGLPVYYIVSPGATLDETRVLNVTQRRWTLLDFANSFAASGNDDYKTFLKYVHRHSDIAPSIIRTYLAGGQKNGLDMDFRRGEFIIENEQEADWAIVRLQGVIDKTNIQMNAPMAHALLRLFKDENNFDYDLFINKLDREGARELLRPAPAIRSCLRSIEDVYNFQSKFQKRLY